MLTAALVGGNHNTRQVSVRPGGKVACYLLLLLLCLTGPTASAQSEVTATPTETSFVVSPIEEALVWLDQNHVENPEGFYEKALETLERAYQRGDDQLTAEAHQLLMRWHAFHVPFTIDSIFHHGEIAIRLFRQTKDSRNLAVTEGQLAFEYVDANEQERAEELVFDAIKIYESLGNRQGLGDAYEQLSSVFLAQDEPELSIKYGLQALEISEEVQDYQNISETWLVLLLAYTRTEEWEKAIHAGDKCIETINAHGLDDVFNLARAYGYRGDAYARLENHQQSLEDNVDSYEIVEAKIGAARPAAKTYRTGIGRAHYMMGNYAQAIPHYAAAIDGYVEMGQGSQLKMEKIYQEAADCYFQVGDFQQAFLLQGRAYGVFDTMMQNKVANLQSEAVIKYESGKKDQAH